VRRAWPNVCVTNRRIVSSLSAGHDARDGPDPRGSPRGGAWGGSRGRASRAGTRSEGGISPVCVGEGAARRRLLAFVVADRMPRAFVVLPPGAFAMSPSHSPTPASDGSATILDRPEFGLAPRHPSSSVTFLHAELDPHVLRDLGRLAAAVEACRDRASAFSSAIATSQGKQALEIRQVHRPPLQSIIDLSLQLHPGRSDCKAQEVCSGMSGDSPGACWVLEAMQVRFRLGR
jgi:hypothetical protein